MSQFGGNEDGWIDGRINAGIDRQIYEWMGGGKHDLKIDELT